METNSLPSSNGLSNGQVHESHEKLDSTTQHKLIEQINLQLAPENLEISKVLTVVNDEFQFLIDDFMNLKEIQKISSDRETMINMLKTLNYIKLSEDEKKAELVFIEDGKVFNLINVPNKVCKDAILKILKINENQIERIYKQSLYWMVICSNKELNYRLDETMRNIKFEDDYLKFETNTFEDIKHLLLKKISHHNYLKEADSLKASGTVSPRSSNHGDRKDSRGWRNSRLGSGSNNNETLSWRKKSDVSNNSKDECLLKGVACSAFKENGGSNGNKIMKRERFNSDTCQKKTLSENVEVKNLPTINIDPETVKYDLNVKFKYSFREMFEFYEKNLTFIPDHVCPFKTYIDDICNKKMKKIHTLNENPKEKKDLKERSYTFHTHVDVPHENWRNRNLNLNSKTEKILNTLPAKNPLHNICQQVNVNVKNN